VPRPGERLPLLTRARTSSVVDSPLPAKPLQ
jgi:hypothetical protein